LDKTDGRLAPGEENIYGDKEDRHQIEETKTINSNSESEEVKMLRQASTNSYRNTDSEIKRKTSPLIVKVIQPDIGRKLNPAEKKWIDIMIKHGIIKEETLINLRGMK